ncbi:MAG: Cys-tRNA(Pro) deacylase [Thermoguttaceae bacterium]|nr:Cys-tRNA(Pro) deacylase [Thermoguttaceae bacterium]
MTDRSVVKTNATRLLTAAGLPFHTKEYEVDESDLSGTHVARQLGLPPEQVFKTLVLKGEKVGYFVCCVPVNSEVDLKKAARAAGDKKAAMIPMKDLKEVTGYIRGGCSPIGMKKPFPTFLDETAILFDEIYLSAGQRGAQIVIAPNVLAEYLHLTQVDLVKD